MLKRIKKKLDTVSLNEWFAVLVSIFVVTSVVANIFEMKTIGWNNFALVGGGILFSGSFFGIMQIINEVWGKKTAKRVTIFATINCFIISLMAQVLIWLPGVYIENNHHFEFIMGQGIRIMIASECAFLLGQLINITIFDKIRNSTKDRKNKRKFIETSTLSTFLGQVIDNFTFVSIAFAPIGISLFEMNWRDIITSVLMGTTFEMIIQLIIVLPISIIAIKLKNKIVEEIEMNKI